MTRKRSLADRLYIGTLIVAGVLAIPAGLFLFLFAITGAFGLLG